MELNEPHLIYSNYNEKSFSSLCFAWIQSRESNLMYLQDVSKLLGKYSWMYNVRNTDVLLYQVLENIPSEWVNALTSVSIEDLIKLPFGYIMNDWPDSLKSFIEECNRLGNPRFPEKHWIEMAGLPEPKGIKKTSSKKCGEIKALSDLIFKVCRETGCYQVLDVGSGLGYLDQELHNSYGIRTIGIDSCSKYTKAAVERIQEAPCVGSMHHETLEVDSSDTCLKQLKDILLKEKNWLCNCKFKNDFQDGKNSTSSVMVGLHSCGNLTQDMMRLFCKSEEMVAFVCVGCCYNKVNLEDFPMSQGGKSAVSSVSDPSWKPCTSGLRLAAHSTRPGLTVLLKTEKYMFYRAVFECFIKKENIEWIQPKRHIRATDVVDFETFCTTMLSKHPLKDDEVTKKKLLNLYEEKLPLFPRVKILLIFQALLQPLWEGFITVDRLFYFKEQNIFAQVISMWDDRSSSRNLALCAFKKINDSHEES